jgi:tRNA (mo5U34)-methyltransferase
MIWLTPAKSSGLYTAFPPQISGAMNTSTAELGQPIDLISPRTPMGRDEMAATLERLKPFLLQVDLPHGLKTGGSPRLPSLMQHSWPALIEHFGGSLAGQTVMDVACVNGGFSLEAAKAGAKEVWGFDVAPHYIEQARFLRDATGVRNARFDVVDLNNLSAETHGVFDVTLCFGIMYHLENPVASMRKIAAMTRKVMLVDTNVMASALRHPFFFMNFKDAYNPNAETARDAGMMWRTEPVVQMKPNKEAVEQLLRFLGFKTVTFIKPGPNAHRRYADGITAAFLAVR